MNALFKTTHPFVSFVFQRSAAYAKGGKTDAAAQVRRSHAVRKTCLHAIARKRHLP